MTVIEPKEMSKVRWIILQHGGYRGVAKMLGLKPITIRKWCTDGVPDRHQAKFREMAGRINVPITDEEINYPEEDDCELLE